MYADATILGKSKSVKICMLMQLLSVKVSFTLFRNYISRASPENDCQTVIKLAMQELKMKFSSYKCNLALGACFYFLILYLFTK